MTDDRALLEAAAKAAGIPVSGEWLAFTDVWCGLRVREDDNPGGYCWNPLQDDAQALRLAVKLRLIIRIREDYVFAEVEGDHEDEPLSSEDATPDPYAATRRAIVRAAAARGERMEG